MSQQTETRPATKGGTLHWSAAVPLGVGLLGMLGSLALGLGSPAQPGPGFWPFVVTTCMVTISAPLLFTRGGAAGAEPFGKGAWQTLTGAGSVGLFVIAFEHFGLLGPSFLLLLFWCRYLGGESWRTSLLVSVLAPSVAHAVFDLGLNVPFPDDILLFWR